VPSSIGTTNKPFHLQPGMHHMEKLDSMDSMEDVHNNNVNKLSPRTKAERIKK